ncbi:SDR family NAD(P)-dependent oxidoreductase [Legionella shakespearei]|uniref:Oxidoreductase n=1 Tax=Legionella shakespearei DSM 23087 TaxID=1122169 RepID=A0A0W0YLA7_9GAMM|nr:SDR family NAD(P)-dependent oxidoreductase [Legionella shakespearei]KTD57666.1 oxidoreductase [Legionella shakespearei DSM 23087]
MTTWIISGATSKIAESFALKAAQEGNQLLLVGRVLEDLEIIANDIRIRTQAQCEIMVSDLASGTIDPLIKFIQNNECSLFLAHAQMIANADLNEKHCASLIETNCTSTVQMINAYLNSKQPFYRIIYLSSVAGDRGRFKNSFYGATKKMVDTYLEGLLNTPDSSITIARLGFIDTRLTYGEPGIFYAAKPEDCGQYLFSANQKGKNLLYYPKFWFFIMFIIKSLPLMIFKRLKF